jgi:hypothetical protein
VTLQQTNEIGTQPLRVRSNHRKQLFGVLAVIGGIVGSIYFYFNNNYDVARCIGPLFGLIGIFLFLISWGWVEATDKTIKTHSLFQTTTIHWNEIYKIDTMSYLGMIVLWSGEGRIDLIPADWAGQDKEKMLALLESKLKETTVQPQEYLRFP